MKRQLLSLFIQRIRARVAFARAAAILALRIESMRQRTVWHCLPAARGELELVTREIMRSCGVLMECGIRMRRGGAYLAITGFDGIDFDAVDGYVLVF